MRLVRVTDDPFGGERLQQILEERRDSQIYDMGRGGRERVPRRAGNEQIGKMTIHLLYAFPNYAASRCGQLTTHRITWEAAESLSKPSV